jgi:hypothetical protein
MKAVQPSAPKVQVAHALEDTDYAMPAPLLDEVTDRAIVPPPRGADRSVELEPELESLATRTAARKTKKRRK